MEEMPQREEFKEDLKAQAFSNGCLQATGRFKIQDSIILLPPPFLLFMVFINSISEYYDHGAGDRVAWYAAVHGATKSRTGVTRVNNNM